MKTSSLTPILSCLLLCFAITTPAWAQTTTTPPEVAADNEVGISTKVGVEQGDTHDRFISDVIAFLNHFGETLEGVKDPASAQAANPKILALVPIAELLTSRAQALGKPEEAIDKQLEKKYEEPLKLAQTRLQTAMQTVFADPTLGPPIGPSMIKIGEAMQKLGAVMTERATSE